MKFISPPEPLDDHDYLNTNSIHDKFLTKQDHNQTQVEIPIVDFLAEQTIENYEKTQKLLSDAENLLDEFEKNLEQ